MRFRLSALLLIAASSALGSQAQVSANSAHSVSGAVILAVADIPSSIGRFRQASPSELGMPGGGSGGRIPTHGANVHGFQKSFGAFFVPAIGHVSHGIVLIDDGALRFASASGAHWYLGAMEQGAHLSGNTTSSAHVGNESIVWTEAGSHGSHDLFLFWRRGRYVGEVTVAFAGSAQMPAELSLARIADGKLARAG